MITLNRKVALKQINENLSRKVLSYGGSLMMAETHFQKSGVGELHKHEDREQLSYVVKGRLELELGSNKTILQQGDSFYVATNVLHRVVILEDAIVLDVFSPILKDWINSYSSVVDQENNSK
jgi:quercetin dioxygenase-like cupin family protein